MSSVGVLGFISLSPTYLDRSNCDVTFFLKVNRYKLSLRDNAQKSSYQVDSFCNHVEYGTGFVKHAG
jgi:hypothetical protein